MNLRMEGFDDTQKQNAKIHYDLTGAIKKKADFTLYLKNKDMIKENKKKITTLQGEISQIVLKTELDYTNSSLKQLSTNFENLRDRVNTEYCTTELMTDKVMKLDQECKDSYVMKPIL